LNSKGEKKEGMNSPAIRKQVSRHSNILWRTLEKKNLERYFWKIKHGGKIGFKEI